MEPVRDAIRQFVLSTALAGESPSNLHDDTPLQTSGILDSLAVMTLATFIERQFGIELDVWDTTAERFDSIEAIVATIERKQLSKAATLSEAT